MFRKRLVSFLFLALLTPAVAFAHDGGHDDISQDPSAQTEATDFQKVGFLLSAYHGVPEKSFFDKIPNARDHIEKIALDNDSVQQIAAVEALGYYPDAGSLETFRALLADKKARDSVRKLALVQLGEHYKESEVFETIKKYTTNKDRYFRISAVRALAALKTDAAIDLIRETRKNEKDPYTRETIDRVGVVIR